MMSAEDILTQAEAKPDTVREALIEMHEAGETPEQVAEFYHALNARKISVSEIGKPVFDICGTGGSGLPRINLSTVLAIKLSKKYCIAKHGNKAASGRVGSFDLIGAMGFEVGDTAEAVERQLKEKNLSFVFAPAFHPALKALAPIRKSIPHPTIFNYLGPLLNPVPLTAQMIGVSSVKAGEIMAETALAIGRNALLVHDMEFGLDDVSIGGKTQFWRVNPKTDKIETGIFLPDDHGLKKAPNFTAIQGGEVQDNAKIAQSLMNGNAGTAHQNFLDINYRVAAEFFDGFVQ